MNKQTSPENRQAGELATAGKFVRLRITGLPPDVQEFTVFIPPKDVNVVNPNTPIYDVIINQGQGELPKRLAIRVAGEKIEKKVEILEISDCPPIAA